jgi:hypothetical protein
MLSICGNDELIATGAAAVSYARSLICCTNANRLDRGHAAQLDGDSGHGGADSGHDRGPARH